MTDIVIEYLLFIGSSLYLIASAMFFYMFLRTLKLRNGIGLTFLRVVTLGASLGSLSIFLVRILSENGVIEFLEARAIAVVNPILLIGIALYLNYLFHRKGK
jgi:hypothetical protein